MSTTRLWKGNAKLNFKQPRTTEVLGAALKAYLEEEKGLHQVVPPERYLLQAAGDLSPLDQVKLLFAFSRLNLSGDKAWNLAEQCARMVIEYPSLIFGGELVNCEHHLFKQPKEQFGEIVRMADGMRPELFDWWMDGLRLLESDGLNGDPRNLVYLADPDRVSIIHSFMRFKGVGHKIAQMTIGFFDWWAGTADERLHEYFKQLGEAFIPVDMWWMRLFRQWDLLESWSTDSRDHISWPISQYVADLCIEQKWPYADLCQAVWHIGSAVCSGRPKENSCKTAEYCHDNCPMNNWCEYLVSPAYNSRGVNRAGQNWDFAVERIRMSDKPRLPGIIAPRLKKENLEIPDLNRMAESARIHRRNWQSGLAAKSQQLSFGE